MKKTALIYTAVRETTNQIHAYMQQHPNSELHRQGKMFGVLVYEETTNQKTAKQGVLRAFSAMLDGSYSHEGFVPPVYAITEQPVGSNKEQSRRLQQLLFAQYNFLNGRGETKNLLEIFQNEKLIITPEEWFSKSPISNNPLSMPPSGAGECCAPKLLQYALLHGWKPIAMAEFWIGAPSRTELRREGVFYPPCSGKCVPILRHMLQGLDVEILRSDTPYKTVNRTVNVLYEDEWLLVADKPAGMLSVRGKENEPALADYLMEQRPNTLLQPVHRLDQDTSGLIVLAKTPDVYKTLQAYFQRRDILKRYEALLRPNDQCSLTNNQLEGLIALPLLPNPYDRPRQMVNHEHGKPAITAYRIREQRPDGTLFVDLFPRTGRTHQLRVHSAHPDGLNAPIVGDRLYGDKSNAERLMLHAAEIRFIHPITNEEMHFCIPSNF